MLCIKQYRFISFRLIETGYFSKCRVLFNFIVLWGHIIDAVCHFSQVDSPDKEENQLGSYYEFIRGSEES